MNALAAAEQLRRAIQMFAATLDEEKAMEVAAVFDPWEPGRAVKPGQYVTFGTNSVGDPQLYKVNDGMGHTTQAGWEPNVSPSMFTAVGLDEDGYPVWSQPTGAHDAYNAGDIVNYNGTLYCSVINGNTYSPDTYPAGWELV